MAATVVKKIAWVDVDPLNPGESIEGHYMTSQPDLLRLSDVDVSCPFCFAPMQSVVAPQFGRICQEQDDQRNGVRVRALVELVPSTHQALKCSGCDMIMTRTNDETAR